MDMILGCTIADGDAEKLSTWQKEQSNKVVNIVKVMADTILLKISGDFLDDYAEPTKHLSSDDLEELERVMNIVNLALQIRE